MRREKKKKKPSTPKPRLYAGLPAHGRRRRPKWRAKKKKTRFKRINIKPHLPSRVDFGSASPGISSARDSLWSRSEKHSTEEIQRVFVPSVFFFSSIFFPFLTELPELSTLHFLKMRSKCANVFRTAWCHFPFSEVKISGCVHDRKSNSTYYVFATGRIVKCLFNV